MKDHIGNFLVGAFGAVILLISVTWAIYGLFSLFALFVGEETANILMAITVPALLGGFLYAAYKNA